jgi:predicted DNA binding CopG/RHH family protein
METAQTTLTRKMFITQPRKRGNPRPKKLHERVCVSFTPNDIEILKDRAKLSGTKLAVFIRELVEQYVRTGTFQKD